MPDDVEEAALPAGLTETVSYGPLGSATREQFAHVDDRDAREVSYLPHEIVLLTSPPEPRL
jgi:hypothetical protein